MPETSMDDRRTLRITALSQAVESGAALQIRKLLSTLHPAEIAHLLESLPLQKRLVVWNLLDPEDDGEVLVYVNDEVRAGLISDMEADELVAAVTALEMDDLADLIQDLPGTLVAQILASMDKRDQLRLEAVLSYPEDSAGGLMNTDTVTVRADVEFDVVLRYLRLRGDIPDMTDSLFVVNRNEKYLGVLPLSTLLTNDPECTVAEMMDKTIKGISAATPADEVALIFEQRNLVSAPVVDDKGKLLGRITIDDVVDVIREEADSSIMRMAGLDEEDDMFAPVVPSASRRAIWLGINLITALLASYVIGLFEEAIDKVVALAILMPIVASMGGVAGSQTLTLVIRALATGKLAQSNTRVLLLKELMIGLLNGVLWALVVAIVAYFWFGDKQIGLIIGAAMIINLLFAAIAGFLLPLILRRSGVDPALAGGVLLTTITDVVGFMAFLGLATWWLL